MPANNGGTPGDTQNPSNSSTGSGNDYYLGKYTDEVLRVFEEWGEATAALIADHLDYPKSRVRDIVKSLRKQNAIHRIRRGWYKFGSKPVDYSKRNGGTHGSGSDGSGGFPPPSHKAVFKLFHKYPYAQNLQGYIDVQDWGDLPKSNHITESGHQYFVHKVKLGGGAYVKLLRQSQKLQVWLAWKRPGFKRHQIYEGMRAIDDVMLEYHLRGKVLWQTIELREQADYTPKIVELKENPIEMSVLAENFVVKFYEEEDGKTNKEIKVKLPDPISSQDLISWLNGISIDLSVMGAMDMFQEKFKHLERGINTSYRLIDQNFQRSIEASKQAKEEIHQNSTFAADTVWDLTQEWKEAKEETVEIRSQLQGLQVQLAEVKEGVSNMSNSQDSQLGEGGTPNSILYEPAFLEAFQNIAKSLEKLEERTSSHDTKLDDLKASLVTNSKIGGSPNSKSIVKTESNDMQYLKHEYGILESDTIKQSVYKVLAVVGSATSDQVHNILKHIRLGSVRKALSHGLLKDELKAIYFVVAGVRRAKYSLR